LIFVKVAIRVVLVVFDVDLGVVDLFLLLKVFLAAGSLARVPTSTRPNSPADIDIISIVIRHIC
jgi:hypothetical protein